MLKNKELKKLFCIELSLFFLSLLIGYGFHHFIDSKYKREFVKSSGYMISAILKTHPELEEEIIDSILSRKGNPEEGLYILKKYGLDQNEALTYLEPFHNLETELMIETTLFIMGIFFLLSIFYFLFLKRQYQRIRQLDDYMNGVASGDYSIHIKDYDEGDLSTLKNDVYKLTIKLKEGRDQSLNDKQELEQILSDISHQIKTPLTSMYVINDLLKKDNLDKQTKLEFLEKNKVQLERIEWLVTSLLKMSRLDSGSIILKKEKVNVKEIVENALDPLRIPIELKDIEVSIEGDFNCKASMDPHWTTEVFVNVLKNAYEHTNKGGKIIVTITSNPIYTEVAIHNTGIGISKEEIPHIFKRFYTGSKNKDSIGIGLNMAKKIMEKQAGEIYATSITNEGTTFFIKFMA